MINKLFIPFLLIFFGVCSPCFSQQDSDDTGILANSEIYADETTRLMLEWLEEAGALPSDASGFLPQPFHVDAEAPASVMHRIYSRLITERIRVSGTATGHHTIRIQWESENQLVEKPGGKSLRTLQSDVIFTWLDSEQVIQKTWSTSFLWEDEVPSGLSRQLAGTWYPSSFHQYTESKRLSVLRRLAEPALIIGAAAVTIYLLYNVRS